MPKTLYDKIWDSHLIHQDEEGVCLLYIDRHLIHEVTSPQAFEGLRQKGRKVRAPHKSLGVADHNVPTKNRDRGLKGIQDIESKIQIKLLEDNCKEFGIPHFGIDDKRQGIVHVVGPEQGLTLPGLTIMCGDSHTSTHGAFGALAHGIGTSEVEHILATQTLKTKKAKNMRIYIEGHRPSYLSAKDVILSVIKAIGTAGATGYVLEYAGPIIEGFSMEARMTVCNMSIEAGAKAGLIAPDDTTYAYLKSRPSAPKGEDFERSVSFWHRLATDKDARFDKDIKLDVSDMPPLVSWGTSPQDVATIEDVVPSPKEEENQAKRKAMERALSYMGLKAGTKIKDIKIDKVFIGSCTNGRIEDLRLVAQIAKLGEVAKGVHAMIVPGSGLVKAQAEQEGLDKIFLEAGFEWRAPGCSMCLAMNADKLQEGERCASTSNRNFEGRQGRGGRTHLVSPQMAAAAALKGHFFDIRDLQIH